MPTPDITLYVTTTGNDANNGSTPALAKRSLYGAWVLLSAGAYNNARVYIEAGDYYNNQYFVGANERHIIGPFVPADGGRDLTEKQWRPTKIAAARSD